MSLKEPPRHSDQKGSDSPSNQRVVLVLVVVLLLVVLLIWLLSNTPSLPQRFSCSSRQPATPQAATPQEAEPKTGYFVEAEVIVIGPAQSVTDVITSVNNQQAIFRLELLQNCDLSYLGRIPSVSRSTRGALPFSAGSLSTLSTRLYEIVPTAGDAQTSLVPEAVKAINAAGKGQEVFADPNYLTMGMQASDVCGRPYGIGGSPYGIGGSPYGIGGSPYGIGGSPYGIGGSTGALIGPGAAQALFWDQWAFEHIAAGAAFSDTFQAASLNYEGQGIRVGVFDTSPFTTTAQQSLGSATTETINWISPTLTLTVASGSYLSAQSNSGLTGTNVITGANQHGLFVSGLIHGIAPESDIVLYRVLDDRGCGDIWQLSQAIGDFTSQVNQDRASLDGAVINLSLGVIKPGNALIHTVVTDTTDSEQGGATGTISTSVQSVEGLDELAIVSLQTAVSTAYGNGIVVVAAAGNDSGWITKTIGSPPFPPQLPAAYPFVIGVEGSNVLRERSCFSNWGSVSAPAGNGGEGVITSTTELTIPSSCMPKVSDCPPAMDCADALISLVLPDPSTPGYAYWSGTSFAAPLVSGLAALTLDAGMSGTTWLHPREVAQAIHCGAGAADGVINVPVTLVRCIPP